MIAKIRMTKVTAVIPDGSPMGNRARFDEKTYMVYGNVLELQTAAEKVSISYASAVDVKRALLSPFLKKHVSFRAEQPNLILHGVLEEVEFPDG